MAEGSNRGNLHDLASSSSPKENSVYNLVQTRKKHIENPPRDRNNTRPAMEIGPFVSAEVDKAVDSFNVETSNHMWSREAERDDLLFQDSDSDNEFVWDSARGSTMPKLDLLENAQQENPETEINDRLIRNNFDSRENDRLLSTYSDGLYSEYNGHQNGTVVQMEEEDSMWHCHQDTPAQVDRVARNQLIAISVICVIFMIGEIIGGVFSHSVALFTDVAHLASDLISFLISLLALYLSTKPATKRMSMGYYRIEVLGALISILMIWLVTGVLCYTAGKRIVTGDYTSVEPTYMLATAVSGVIFNVIMGVVLISQKCGSAASHLKFGHSHGHGHSHGNRHSHSHGHSHNSLTINSDRPDIAYSPLLSPASEEDLTLSDDAEMQSPITKHENINIRAAFIHVVGDIIQSLGVLIAALIIKFTNGEEYKLADPICTFVFSVLVMITTVKVLRDTLHVVIEAVPKDIEYHKVLNDIRSIPGVKSAHSLALWALTVDKNAVTVHISIDGSNDHQKILERTSRMLRTKYKFIFTTIQVEMHQSTIMESCRHCSIPNI
ncbi:proton-coupled zinc antiporter SLC30A2-like [Saccostrea echinata]|uniref:proton-coupled zinc antiporter SLC30A2-like n=1 Tax=Saccostrea echinata TaxID=191078 RepID=UPI002A8063F5|nr:proton-coupled zinc antiporter SLC30A2-like [Saccostrea echinata]